MSEMHDLRDARKFDAALWDRMEALVRRMAKRAVTSTPGLVPAHGFPDFYEARAIVELLPEPVDPDLVEMRDAARAAGWNESRLDQFEVGLLDLWKRARSATSA